jgi:hypothetical protein
MALNLRSSIYSEIADQFPDIYKENGDFLVSFVEAYYKHLDEKMDRDVPKLRDIDDTLSSFLVFFKRKYLADLPLDSAIDVRFVLKHIKDMYTRKGTQESLELLFRIFFDQDIEVFYPSTSILRPSDSIWGGDAYLEMRTVFQVDDYPIEKGDRIRGDLSQATAFVDEVIFVNFSGSLSPIIYLSNITGSFSADDGVIVVNADGETNVGKLISGSLSEVNISDLNRVANQNVGDALSIRSSLNGIDATARVLTTSQQETGSIDFRVTDEGFGYLDPNSVLGATAFNSIGISNQVLIVNNDTVLNLKPGDVVGTPKTLLEYDGDDEADATQYSLHGYAKVIQYNHPLLFVESGSITDYENFIMLEPFSGFNTNTALVNALLLEALSFSSSNVSEMYPYQEWGSLLAVPFPDSGETNPAGDLDGDGSITLNDVIGGGISTINSFIPNDPDGRTLSTSITNTDRGTGFLNIWPTPTPVLGVSGNQYYDQYFRYWRALTLLDFYKPITITTVRNPETHDIAENANGVLNDGIAYPTGLTNSRFELEVNHDSNDTISIVGFGVFNETAQFTVGSLTNTETVTLITDQIGEFADVVLDADGNPVNDDFGMSGPGEENLNTTITDAFTPITLTIGSVDQLDISNPGSNYQNDVFASLDFDLISKFKKHDFILNFDVVDFNVSVGDLVTQQRTIPDIEVGLTGNLDESAIEALPASTTSGTSYTESTTTFDYIAGGDVPYTAKAKFLKREGSDFYFRPLSFHGFDEERDASDNIINPISIGGVSKSFSGLREDEDSAVMGNNASIQGVASYQTGQISTVAITKTGYRYQDGETVEIFNEEANSPSYGEKVAEATIRTLGQGKTEGRWKSKTSFLSEVSKRIHDNDYYQEYSYDVSSIVDPKKYTGLISDVVGVAGTKLFSTPLINSDNTIDTSLDAEFVYYDIQSQKFIATDGATEFDYITQNTLTYPGVNSLGESIAVGSVRFMADNKLRVFVSGHTYLPEPAPQGGMTITPEVGGFVHFSGTQTDVADGPSGYSGSSESYQIKEVTEVLGINNPSLPDDLKYYDLKLGTLGSLFDVTFTEPTYALPTDISLDTGWTNGLTVSIMKDLDTDDNQFLVADIATQTGVS